MRIPDRMEAAVLTGHGGLDRLSYRRDVPVPRPGPGEVLIQVGAAGVNNTDINTRIAWYSKQVTSATSEDVTAGSTAEASADGSWSGAAMIFPRIQGADCCGEIVAVGEGVETARLGERVLVRALQPSADDPFACITFGSECDGAFGQYTKTAAAHALRIDCDWSDIELASMPCAFSTAEGMLQRAAIGAERVLVTGASGGVGSAAVQLAKRRGAEVIAVCGRDKAGAVAGLGADLVLERGADPVASLASESIDAVVDLVGGPAWPRLLDLLRRGGRYVTAGAIAGPIVELDLRTLYLKDLSLLGSTWQPFEIMTNLIGYIERGEIRPVVAKTYPLHEIVQAQQTFLEKHFVGKLVLIPPKA
ncbi:alcohol dehydrogenase family protein [Algihabitans albus]|uniref:alcohol dehydrogenase family protein n=1 Tax=Algihabitans albus TaxID=2164067 RepID=UPI000E5C637C|nr:alcohol dehydrogenase family protein [Algihabitans albus]